MEGRLRDESILWHRGRSEGGRVHRAENQGKVRRVLTSLHLTLNCTSFSGFGKSSKGRDFRSLPESLWRHGHGSVHLHLTLTSRDTESPSERNGLVRPHVTLKKHHFLSKGIPSIHSRGEKHSSHDYKIHVRIPALNFVIFFFFYLLYFIFILNGNENSIALYSPGTSWNRHYLEVLHFPPNVRLRNSKCNCS